MVNLYSVLKGSNFCGKMELSEPTQARGNKNFFWAEYSVSATIVNF
jgi:hypothetical protein